MAIQPLLFYASSKKLGTRSDIVGRSPDRKVNFVMYLFSGGPKEYDFLLRLLSLGRDRYWRQSVVEEAKARNGDTILDIACGTGLMSYQFAANGVHVVGIDVTRAMLDQARKLQPHSIRSVDYVLARAENIPLRSDVFDAAVISLATRNVSNALSAFDEMRRCIKPGKKVISMDFTLPENKLFGPFYNFYISKVLPAFGMMISRHWNAIFVYLANSIKKSRTPEQIAGIFNSLGMTDPLIRRMTQGVMAIVSGRKSLD